MLTHTNNHMLVNNLFPLWMALMCTASFDPPYALLDEADAIICTLQRRTLRFREAENFGLGHTVVVVGPGLVATPRPTAVLSVPSAWGVGVGAPCRLSSHVVGQSSCCSGGYSWVLV